MGRNDIDVTSFDWKIGPMEVAFAERGLVHFAQVVRFAPRYSNLKRKQWKGGHPQNRPVPIDENRAMLYIYMRKVKCNFRQPLNQ